MPIRIVSFNPNGLKTKGRVASLLQEAKRLAVDVLLVQEHNLDYSCSSGVLSESSRLGYIACVGYSNKGGSAIFVRAAAFELDPRQPLDFSSYLEGRLTIAKVVSGKETLTFASMYVPVDSARRGRFIERLRARKLLTRSTIVGMDANCVLNPSVDVFYPSNSRSSYSNSHASRLEHTLSGLGLADIHCFMNGKTARGYTRECATVATRIDRLCAPTVPNGHEWISLRVNGSFGRSAWNPDHRAIEAVLNPTQHVDKAKPKPKISQAVYSCPQAIASIETLFQDIISTYPPREYGYAVVHQYFKDSARDLLLQLSREASSRPAGATRLLRTQLQALTDNIKGTEPSKERVEQLRKTSETLAEEAKKYKSAKGRRALRLVEMEERNTKGFNARFKPRHTKKSISQLFEMDGLEATDRVASDTDALLRTSAGYYEQLMAEKPSCPKASEPLLDTLRARPLSEKAAKQLEGRISEKEVRKAIRSMATHKACGPDDLAAELYKTHEDMLATHLTEVYNEMHTEGTLLQSMREGEIILLYKKKDPRDIRNYRPITLLNADYKILSKILVARLKPVMNDFISPAQTGFVPKRQIKENSLLCKLIQAYLDETDEEGLFLFLDLEKAFDRVSHEYLHKALEASGLGRDMLSWIELLYDPHHPMYRRTQVNGHTSEYFPIRSSVAQGCPLSPILYLFVTEGLTRLIEQDPNYKGIQVGKNELRLSQFADDTVLFLRHYKDINYVFSTILPLYEKATGMKVNVTKTEGLPLGRLRNSAPPSSLPEGIAWCPEGSYIISLGIPIGNNFDERSFWLEKYYKCKRLLAGWHELSALTIYGRALLANSMIFSRFRYWAQCMHMPTDIVDALCEDVQVMIWAHDPEHDVEEVGSDQKFRRWISKDTQYLPQREGGLSLLHWPSHLKALLVAPWLTYPDGSQGNWKLVLDEWISKRYFFERGTPFTTIPAAHMLRSLTRRTSALPLFFKKGLTALRSLTLTPVVHGRFTSCDEARAEPVWHSHRFKITNTNHADTWRADFHLNRLQDFTVVGEKREWSQREIKSFLSEHTVQVNRAALKFFRWPGQYRHLRSVTVHQLLNQWNSFERDVGYLNIAATWSDPSPLTDPRYSLFVRREMRRQGWLGPPRKGGLGATGQGISEPIDHKIGQPNVDKSGVGIHKRARALPRTKDKYSTLVGVVRSGGIGVVYGYPQERNGTEYLQVTSLTPQGLPQDAPASNRDALKRCDFSRMRSVLWWHGVAGIAETTYPHPNGWTFKELETPTPLHKIRIRHLTIAFRNAITVTPACWRAWEVALGESELPRHLVYQRLYHPALTSRDRKNNMRIINRSLRTRYWDDRGAACRLCGAGQDRLSHLGYCPKLTQLFSVFENPAPPCLIYLGLRSNRQPLTGSDAVLYTTMWKFVLIAYTRVDCEGEEFDGASILTSAMRRAHTRLEAMSGELKLKIEQSRSRGEPLAETTLSRYRKLVTPDFSFDTEGRLTACPPAARVLRAAGCDIKQTEEPPVEEQDDESEWHHYEYPSTPPAPSRLSEAASKLESALKQERERLDKARRWSVAQAKLARKNRT